MPASAFTTAMLLDIWYIMSLLSRRSRYTHVCWLPCTACGQQHGSALAHIQTGCRACMLQGDQLIATSGYTYSRESDYQSVVVRSGETVVRLNARGEVGALLAGCQQLLPSTARQRGE